MVRRAFLIAALIAALALARPAPTRAATLLVDDDKVQCPSAGFTTIQSAIDNASGGDTIEVCAGNYVEQLTIGSGKNNLTLRSVTPQQAIIRPPEGLANFGGVPLIYVNGAANVTIQGFWITGPVPVTVCSPAPVAALLVENGGSVTVQRNFIAEVRPADPAVNRCYPSYGVLVRPGERDVATSATVLDNLIVRYLTGGVLAEGGATSATIMRNQILGDGPSPVGRQMGVEIRGGATAEIVDNDVARNKYIGSETVFSTGIRLDQSAGNVRVERNRTGENDYGIALSALTGAIVRSNQVMGNAIYGIAAFADVRRSLFESNQARDNGNTDCIDFTMGNGTASTANQWQRNDSRTAIPAGICGIE